MGGPPRGLSFNLAKNIMTQLLRDGVVHRGYLGIQIKDIDNAELAGRLGLKEQNGVLVTQVFENAPGKIYHARITAIPRGIGQGQIATSGTLARTTALGGTSAFPAEISIPDEMSRDSLRLGISGNATAFAANAGVIGLLASILVWVSSYTAYL